MSAIRFTIEELALPASTDAEDAGDFRAYVEVRNRVETDIVGTVNETLGFHPIGFEGAWQKQV